MRRADDGRTVAFDLAQVPPSLVPFPREGRRVVVLGTYGLPTTTLHAQAIEYALSRCAGNERMPARRTFSGFPPRRPGA